MIEYRAIAGADGQEDLAVSTSVVTLTLPAAFSANTIVQGRAMIQVRTASIVFSLNGVDPTAADASTGHTLAVGDVLSISGSELAALKMIRATGTNAAVNVRYERRVN